MKKILNILLISASSLLLACEGFLDLKPDQGLLVPRTLDDVQILMDNNDIFNRQATLVNVSADDFWTTSGAYQGMSVLEQGAYLWQEDPYQGSGILDWEAAYKQVFYANIALETLDKYTGLTCPRMSLRNVNLNETTKRKKDTGNRISELGRTGRNDQGISFWKLL